MTLHTIEVQIDEQFQAQVQLELLHRVALATLIHQRVEEPCELAVVVTGDEALHELNRRYRDVDAPTDVLAFPDETRGPFVGAPGLPRYLGDIIISFPRAEAQAAEAGHDVQAELQLLVVHGVLHLLGYDDVTEEQRAQMWAAQAEILQALGIEAHSPG
nr:rRNA maturation RNase YbeY [Anaerolineae bacterium]